MRNLIAFLIVVLIIIVMGCSDDTEVNPDIGALVEIGAETSLDGAPQTDIAPVDGTEGAAADASEDISGAQDGGDPENVGHD